MEVRVGLGTKPTDVKELVDTERPIDIEELASTKEA